MPEQTSVFTVKLPSTLVAWVRESVTTSSALVVTGIGLEVRGAGVVEDQAGRPQPGMSRMCGRSGRRKLDLTNTDSRRFNIE